LAIQLEYNKVLRTKTIEFFSQLHGLQAVLLGNRKKSYSIVAKLETKHELKLCNLQLSEKVAFLTALKGRRTVLVGA
jgi:hypothetical protein